MSGTIRFVVGDILIAKGSDGDKRFRVINIYNNALVLVCMDITALQISMLAISYAVDQIHAHQMEHKSNNAAAIDIEKLSTKQQDAVALWLPLMESIVHEYGPTYEKLGGKVSKPIIEEFARQNAIGKKTVWKHIRDYFQSGCQVSSLLDGRTNLTNTQRTYRNKPGKKCRNFVTGDIEESGKLLDDHDLKIFRKEWKRYLNKEDSELTMKNIYSDMCRDYYSTRQIVYDADGSAQVTFHLKDEVPSFRQFMYRYYKETTAQSRMEAKKGKSEVRNNNRVLHGTVHQFVEGPYDCVFVDAQEMDLWIVSNEYPYHPVGRIICYVMIDVDTELIVGASFAFDNNSVVGLTNVYMNLLQDKGKLLDQFHVDYQLPKGCTIDDVWPTGFRPSTYHCDNGSDFLSDDISRINTALHISPKVLPARMGSLKGLVEGFFSSVLDHCIDQLQHKGLITKRYDSDHQTAACLTYEEAVKILYEQILYHNCHVIKGYHKSAAMKRDGIPARPYCLFQYNRQKHEPIRFSSRDQALYDIMLPAADAAISRRGVFWNGLTYFMPRSFDDNELDRDMEDEMFNLGEKRKKIDLRYDPRDMGHLYYLRDGQLMHFSLPADDSRFRDYFGMSFRTYTKLQKDDKENNRAEEKADRNALMNLRYQTQVVVSDAAAHRGGTKDATNIRVNRETEQQRISAMHSVDETFHDNSEDNVTSFAVGADNNPEAIETTEDRTDNSFDLERPVSPGPNATQEEKRQYMLAMAEYLERKKWNEDY